MSGHTIKDFDDTVQDILDWIRIDVEDCLSYDYPVTMSQIDQTDTAPEWLDYLIEMMHETGIEYEFCKTRPNPDSYVVYLNDDFKDYDPDSFKDSPALRVRFIFEDYDWTDDEIDELLCDNERYNLMIALGYALNCIEYHLERGYEIFSKYEIVDEEDGYDA